MSGFQVMGFVQSVKTLYSLGNLNRVCINHISTRRTHHILSTNTGRHSFFPRSPIILHKKVSFATKCSAESKEGATSEDVKRQQERFSLAGKTAIVTGGHKGIGEAISLGIARAGGNVIVIDRSGPKDSGVPSKIEAVGGRHASVTADLSNEEEVSRAAKEAKEQAASWGGRIDILVNNAGLSKLAPLEEMGEDVWDMTMSLNLRAPMLLMREIAKGDNGMISHGTGSIINISSLAAQSFLDDHAAYATSKGALEMVTRYASVEWGPHGIRANAIAPTVVLTEMGREVWQDTKAGEDLKNRLPVRRFAEPEEVSDVVVFLCSDASGMITGATIPIDGGYSQT